MGITEIEKAAIAAAMQRVWAKPGVKPRRSQNAMVGAVARAFAAENHDADRRLLVEGPTGTGKSLGYLIPALVLAEQQQRALIISTATVALQEQLAAEVAPLAEWIGIDIPVAVLKGRGRYLCPAAVTAKTAVDPGQGELAMSGHSEVATAWAEEPAAELRSEVGRIATSWEEGDWSGDFDALPYSTTAAARSAVSSTAASCQGGRCRFFSACPVMTARSKTEGAQVVITNHALLLADLAGEGQALLPSINEAMVVMDEAHQIPRIAIDQFALHMHLSAADRWVRSTGAALERAYAALPRSERPSEGEASRLQTTLERARDELETFGSHASARLAAHVESGSPDPQAVYGEGVPERLQAVATRLAKLAATLVSKLTTARTHLAKLGKSGDVHRNVASAASAALADAHSRVDQLLRVASAWGQPAEGKGPPWAYWVEAGEGLPSVGCSPTSAAKALQERLLHPARALVMTSATLRALGDFAPFRRSVGAAGPSAPPVAELCLSSPFDFAAQGTIWIPPDAANPKTPGQSERDLARSLKRHALPPGAGGTLVLFTARARMQRVLAALPSALRDACKVQGDRELSALLASHASDLEAGKQSLLVGLASFSEGLDLPGVLCRRVIAERLPFSVPSDPVETIRKAWLESRGLSYFDLVALPHCALRLTQLAGRLIRREEDRGDIVVLDRRLADTRWGRRLWDALPPFARRVEDPAPRRRPTRPGRTTPERA